MSPFLLPLLLVVLLPFLLSAWTTNGPLQYGWHGSWWLGRPSSLSPLFNTTGNRNRERPSFYLAREFGREKETRRRLDRGGTGRGKMEEKTTLEERSVKRENGDGEKG